MKYQEHNTFMRLAMQEAIQAGNLQEVPIGAVLVQDGKVIAQSGNRVERNNDPTQHAEMIVIKQASQKLGTKRLPNCELYVSLEPCTMCAGAIAMARLKSVYFAASDPKGGGIIHGAKFFTQPTCHHKPYIEQLVKFQTESAQFLQDFFKKRR